MSDSPFLKKKKRKEKGSRVKLVPHLWLVAPTLVKQKKQLILWGGVLERC